MVRLRVIARLMQIQRVMVRHGLYEFLRATHLYYPFRLLACLSPWTWFQRSGGVTRGERLRLALEELGPTFLKLGQVLSTRRDLVPVDIADELVKLQDRVPPFDSEVAVATIERAFGCPVGDIFAAFEQTPLAAASVAQVHVARLKTGQEVVVKILRPGMHEAINRDIEVLETVAILANQHWRGARRLRPIEVVREYRKTLLDELDLLREAGNAAQLKRNFAGSPLLYVPVVYWDYCRVNVMVMERIHGIVVSQTAELRSRGVNIAKLAENGVEIFFTQVFKHNFFHADMHPGNIFVQVEDPRNPRYAAIDFGIVGSLQPRDQHYLAETFMALFERDYARVAAQHVNSGWVPSGTRVDELESAVRTVCDPIFNKPLKDISFAHVMLRLFEVAHRFDVEVQPQLILLQKTLLNIEGLGRELHPELDLWKTAQPILRACARERMSPRAVLRQVRWNLPHVLEAFRQLSPILQSAAGAVAGSGCLLRFHDTAITEFRDELVRAGGRRDAVIGAGALWFSGLIGLTLLSRYPWIGWAQIFVATTVFIWCRPLKRLIL